jgi:hypothetical protein
MGNGFTAAQLKQRGFSPDASGSWSRDSVPAHDSRSSAAEHQRDECGSTLAAEKDQRPGEGGIRYRVIVHSYRTRLIDPSNASIKQIEDCLTPPQGRKAYGIGVIPDDSAQYCDQPLFLQTQVKKGEERTEIEVLKYNV